MKRITIQQLCLILLLSAWGTGCDLIDMSPKGVITDKSYWSKVEDLELYANGLYGYLPRPTAHGDEGSDNFVKNNKVAILFDNMNQESASGGWSWGDIGSCNYFLQRVGNVKGDEKEINKYTAEVRFFRGLLYYNKIKRYGDVPWYETDLKTNDEELLTKPRDKRDEVLGKIIEDMEYAIRWLPEKENAVLGRLHKDAARTQLARICLYYGTYMKYHGQSGSGDLTPNNLLKKVVKLTDDIMATGRYEIVQGSDQGCDQLSFPDYPLYYSNQFTQRDLSTNKENILARYYTEGVLTHETGRQVGENGVGLSKDFVESFLMKDGTPIYNPESGYKGDENLGDEFVDRDPRIYQIIDNPHKPYRVKNGERYVNELPSVDNVRGVTGYPCVKYRSANEKQENARNTYYDWFIYRYAEVLLMNAEAHAELGSCTQPILDKTINKLRDRVEMAHLTVNPTVDAAPVNYGYTISPLLYEIRRERRIELIAEGRRFDDLQRWNAMTLLENPKTMLGIRITPSVREAYKKANTTFGPDARPTIEYQGKTYLYQYPGTSLQNNGRKWTKDDKRWLFPIPKDQLILNRNLTQNPGWEGVSGK